MSKPIPKSLHTVTVLVMLARRLMQSSQQPRSADAAVDMALSILGYDADTVDTYGLKAQAVAKLGK
jgi:hypothetical protein